MQIGKMPYGRQTIEKDDIAAVTETLKSDFLTQGPQVPKFEEAVASYCGAKHACAVNSGTSALHVAYLALGVRPGSRVWTTPVTFVATSNAALMCGAEVSFIDVDPMTGNISTTALAASLQTAARDHELPDVVTVVHLGGLPCDMKKISELAALYHFRVIEDCCHALGSEYRGEMIGSCRYSDISVFSFHPVKAITTGEGGMALTNNEKLWQRMKLLSSHGITKDDEVFEEKPDGGWYYEQQMLGFNYRMPDISAALGISQLKKLPQFLKRRRAIAERYLRELAGTPARCFRAPDGYLSSYHLFIVHVDRRKEVYDALRAEGIMAQIHYIPVYHQPYYRHLLGNVCLECTEEYYSTCLSLPVFPLLRDDQQTYVITRLKEIMSELGCR